MSRVQLAINVSDVEAAVAFYSKLFDTEPAKRRPGYANFAIAEPPLKLVLIQGDGVPATVNHLGVEVEDPGKVQEAITRFAQESMPTDVEEGVTCCYAVQDKVWVTDPDGAKWEVYTVLVDADRMAPLPTAAGDGCCANASVVEHAPAEVNPGSGGCC
jgi:catechol 2,3-dioxygenase-like lactoylglutathione lyase family enzyme